MKIMSKLYKKLNKTIDVMIAVDEKCTGMDLMEDLVILDTLIVYPERVIGFEFQMCFFREGGSEKVIVLNGLTERDYSNLAQLKEEGYFKTFTEICIIGAK